MKQSVPALLPLIVFFILLFAYTKIIGPIPFSISSVTTNKSDTFTVTGEGKVAVRPDIAAINVGIQASGTTVKQTQEQINIIMNQVAAAIKKLGVEDKDIQTTNYNINPTYDFRSGSQKISGYQANTNLLVKVKVLDKINEVIDAATANGANQVGSIIFDVSDKAKAENEAREQAVNQAKQKAEQAAKVAGFNLGKIVNYSESFAGNPPPMPLSAKAVDGRGSPETTNVEPGSSEIKITVSLSYETL